VLLTAKTQPGHKCIVDPYENSMKKKFPLSFYFSNVLKSMADSFGCIENFGKEPYFSETFPYLYKMNNIEIPANERINQNIRQRRKYRKFLWIG